MTTGTGEALSFIATGFMVVMLALALLWLVSAAIGRAFAAGAAKPSAAAPAPAGRDAPPAAHLAAISAAVAVLTGGRGRIVSVHAPAHVADAWVNEGRSDQLSSHRVRWDWEMPGPPHVEHPIAQAPSPPPDGQRSP